MDIEVALARDIVKRTLFVGPIVVGVAWAIRGPVGALSALTGVAIVVGNFLLSGWLMSTAMKISLSAYHAAALFGFLLRLALIAGAMFAVAALFDVDRYAMGIAAVGILLKLTTGPRFPKLSSAIYLAMGWMVLIAIRPLWQNVPGWGIALLVFGGLAYTLGVVFYLAPRRKRIALSMRQSD